MVVKAKKKAATKKTAVRKGATVKRGGVAGGDMLKIKPKIREALKAEAKKVGVRSWKTLALQRLGV